MRSFASKNHQSRGGGLADADQQRITVLRARFDRIVALLAAAEHKIPAAQREAIHEILTDIANSLSPARHVVSATSQKPQPSTIAPPPAPSIGVHLTNEGRRVYFSGNTFPFRDELRSAGAHWDPQRKAWWTGKTSEAQAILDRLIAKAAKRQPSRHEESIAETDKVVIGRAQYEGKNYYVLATGWSKTTGKRYAKLAYRDGSRVFWAAHPEKVVMQASYQEPKSIRALRAYAEQAKSDEYRTDDYRIDKNGVHWVRVSGSRGWYWTEASKHDEFDEFDN